MDDPKQAVKKPSLPKPNPSGDTARQFKEVEPGVYEDSTGRRFGINNPDKTANQPLPEGVIHVEPSDPKNYGR